MSTAFGLTHRQHQALQFITRHIDNHGGVGPSLEEIAAALGNRSKSTAHRIIDGLMQRGLVRRLGRTGRSVTLVSQSVGGLPLHVHARLSRYCAAHNENFDAVLADAVLLHLDELELSDPSHPEIIT